MAVKRLFSYVYFEILNFSRGFCSDSVEFLYFSLYSCSVISPVMNANSSRTDLELLRFLLFEQLLDLTLALCGVAGHADEEAALYIVICSRSSFSSLQLIMMFLPCSLKSLRHRLQRHLRSEAFLLKPAEHRITQYISLWMKMALKTPLRCTAGFSRQSSPGLPWRNTDHHSRLVAGEQFDCGSIEVAYLISSAVIFVIPSV